MSDTKTYILSVGMISAVGLDAMQSYGSVKAGITKFAESSVYDKQFNPVVMSILPDKVLPPLEAEVEDEPALTSRQKRMLRLATAPLQEVLLDIPNTDNIPLYLGVPEILPDRPPPVKDNFIQLLSSQAKTPLNLANSRLFYEGRAAALSAINAAIETITNGEAEFVLVGGVDTYLDLYLLTTLDMEKRIASPTTLDGLIPGEGAAFLLIGNATQINGIEKQPYATLLSSGIGFETGHLYSQDPYKGDGLADAFAIMFENYSEEEKVNCVYVGFNGENFSSKEWGVAYLRNKKQIAEHYQTEHPVDCLGDPGAAHGAIMSVLATIGLTRKTLAGPCIVWGSSDYGTRAAILLNST